MPELPEVQTTVNGLSETIVGLSIRDVWSDYNSKYFKGSDTIKDLRYFKHLKKEILRKKVVLVSRRAKNILIHIENMGKSYEKGTHLNSGTSIILIHMKMTGHLLYGEYHFSQLKRQKNSVWIPISPQSLKDPFNRHIHFVITFNNGKRLALCDSRKFAKVTLIENDQNSHDLKNNSHSHHLLSHHLKNIGPEPLEKSFTFEKFLARLKLKPTGKIKLVLLDQTIIAGIGNIYADESLWRAGIHPMEQVKDIPNRKLCELFKAIKQTLSKGIDFGGDSMSDYRNVHGEKGKFQENHRAYQKTGERCSKSSCKGTIRRIVVGGRGTHFCDMHQKLHRNQHN